MDIISDEKVIKNSCVADFLFPKDLEVSTAPIKKIMLIGSCLSDRTYSELKKINVKLEITHISFNNALELPNFSQLDLSEYSYIYIQIPLRSILSDGIVRIADLENKNDLNDWVTVGQRNLAFILKASLKYAEFNILTFVSNFLIPQGRIAPSLEEQDSSNDLINIVRGLNTSLAAEVRKYSNVFVADVDMIANSLGKMYFQDDSTGSFYSHASVTSLEDWIVWEEEFSAPAPNRLISTPGDSFFIENKISDFFYAMYRQAESMYRTINQIDSVKIVIFDLDNTLWRGLIGEHYNSGDPWPQLHGWPPGLWETISHLRRRGILVSICSKNDESTVLSNWTRAIPIPFIKYDDFISPKINWASKADNIREILSSVSLTPKNALFVDDNPIERASVSAQLPGIRTIGSDPFSTRRILLWAPETQIFTRTNESLSREKSIKGLIQRKEDQTVMSRQQFLASLETEVCITELKSTNSDRFSRVFELTNKTNQFNTTGIRRSYEDFSFHFAQGGRIFVFDVKDKYSNYGLVGVIFFMGNCIVQFLMSCRVLGMDIEIVVIEFLLSELAPTNNSQLFLGLVVPNGSNTPSHDVFKKSGFNTTETPGVFIIKNEFFNFENNNSITISLIEDFKNS